MNKTLKFKIATDVVMTVLLLFLMSYQLVGNTAHEWLGVAATARRMHMDCGICGRSIVVYFL